jgi:hypothetical protein
MADHPPLRRNLAKDGTTSSAAITTIPTLASPDHWTASYPKLARRRPTTGVATPQCSENLAKIAPATTKSDQQETINVDPVFMRSYELAMSPAQPTPRTRSREPFLMSDTRTRQGTRRDP